MLRISKMADYGTLVMAYLAQHPELAFNAKEIAERTRLTVPTVSKLLKLLTRAGLLTSLRGAQGGYRLAQAANSISLAQIIDALDGGMRLTECSHPSGLCFLESTCALHSNWKFISQTIRNTLQNISLNDMLQKQHFPIDVAV